MKKLTRETDSLSTLRQTLKYEVWAKRSLRGAPYCPICGAQFRLSEPSMHEAFVPRSVVRGCSEEVQQLIYVPENVVLVHEGKCHIKAQHSEEGKILCAMQIIHFEGVPNVSKWMDLIDSNMRTRDNNKRTIMEKAIKEMQDLNATIL